MAGQSSRHKHNAATTAPVWAAAGATAASVLLLPFFIDHALHCCLDYVEAGDKVHLQGTRCGVRICYEVWLCALQAAWCLRARRKGKATGAVVLFLLLLLLLQVMTTQ